MRAALGKARIGAASPAHTLFFFIYNPLIYFFYFFLFFTPLCFGCCGSGRVVIAAFCRPRSGFISLPWHWGSSPCPLPAPERGFYQAYSFIVALTPKGAALHPFI